LSLIGVEDTAEDADPDSLFELLEAVDSARAPVLSGNERLESEDTPVTSIDLDGGNTTEASAASTPSSSFSHDHNAQASTSSEASAGPSQDQRLQRRALGSRRLRTRKKARRRVKLLISCDLSANHSPGLSDRTSWKSCARRQQRSQFNSSACGSTARSCGPTRALPSGKTARSRRDIGATKPRS